MARKTFSITMDEELIKKLDEVATLNHRRRGPEVNVAVEFYLKHQGIDIDKINEQKSNTITIKEESVDIDMGDFGFEDDDN